MNEKNTAPETAEVVDIKKAKKESDVRLVLVLTLVCAISAGFLTGVYALTKDKIDEAERMKVLRAVQEVLPQYANEPDTEKATLMNGQAVLYPAKDENGNPIGYAVSSTNSEGYGGDIIIMVGVLPDGSINNLKVVSAAQETPGLGVKVKDDSFLGQFRGKSLNGFKFVVKKDGGDVDSVTAATISSRAATKAIAQALEAVKEYKEQPPTSATAPEEAGS